MITNEQALEKFTLTDAAIAMMAEQFLPLKINGVEDKVGYSRVREARLIVKSKRVEVEKVRKELKEDSLRYGRIVDAEAKRITSLLEPIEKHLLYEENQINTEIEKIAEEKERKQKEFLQNRVDAFLKYDSVSRDLMSLAQLSEEDFQKELECAKFEFEEKQKRLAEIEAEKRAEAERLKIEAERQAKIAIEQRAAQEKIDAERKAIEDEKRAIEEQKLQEEAEKKRQLELEQTRIEAAEKARIETEERIKRERFEKMEQERLAKEEAENLEALRPDKEKLLRFAAELANIKLPTLTTKEATIILQQVQASLISIIDFIEKSAEKLHKKRKAAV